MLATHQVTRLYAKPLAPNDNSKNQVYLGPDFSALNVLPTGNVVAEPGKPQFKASLGFSWLGPNGQLSPAPFAQLILYPQYPEVRFSGFLRGSPDAPSNLMASRAPGRILFLSTTRQGTVIGHVSSQDSVLSREFRSLRDLPVAGVFVELPLEQRGSPDGRVELLRELRRIHKLDWIRSKRLGKAGHVEACESPNCGGYTLEAELGIQPNGISEPDFQGWEVKQHGVNDLSRAAVGVLTLMTPEPNGGFYKTEGVEAFVRLYGYPDMNGRNDRLNFGGIHKFGIQHPLTKLTLATPGFDAATGKIIDAHGGIALVAADGSEAATWRFDGLMRHWNRKHRQAAYVPSQMQTEPARRYRYGGVVRIGDGTDFLLFLKSLTAGNIYYDPGIKVEDESSAKPKVKRRSQFRIRSADLGSLYDNFAAVSVL
jgi:hypothetical protein